VRPRRAVVVHEVEQDVVPVLDEIRCHVRAALLDLLGNAMVQGVVGEQDLLRHLAGAVLVGDGGKVVPLVPLEQADVARGVLGPLDEVPLIVVGVGESAVRLEAVAGADLVTTGGEARLGAIAVGIVDVHRIGVRIEMPALSRTPAKTRPMYELTFAIKSGKPSLFRSAARTEEIAVKLILALLMLKGMAFVGKKVPSPVPGRMFTRSWAGTRMSRW
jgi:hypothetical protein